MAATEQLVLVGHDADSAVQTLTLNQPEKLNALSGAMLQLLTEAVRATNAMTRFARWSSPEPARAFARVPT